MKQKETMPMGIVVERRDSGSPWQDHVWRPVAVIPGAAPADPAGSWRKLRDGEGWVQYHAGTLTLELYRSDTEAYRATLRNAPPLIYVVLREDEDAEYGLVPFAVTASPYEAQDFLDAGEDVVEGVPMPDGVVAWVGRFVDTHHVDQPFRKRRLRRRGDAPDRPGEARVVGSDDGHGN